MKERYTELAIRLLRRKPYLLSASEALREQIRFLEEELAVRRADPAREIGAAEDAERDTLCILQRLDDSRRRLRVMEEELEQIRRGYRLLDPYARDLLEIFFVSGEKNCAEKIAERYYKERSTIYRDRKKALESFVLAVFGVLPET